MVWFGYKLTLRNNVGSDVFTWIRNFIININPNLKTSRLIEELVVIIDQNLPPKAFMNHDQSKCADQTLLQRYCNIAEYGVFCLQINIAK